MNYIRDGILYLGPDKIVLGSTETEVAGILHSDDQPRVSELGQYSFWDISPVKFYDVFCEYEFMFQQHVLKKIYITPLLDDLKNTENREVFYGELRQMFISLVNEIVANSNFRKTEGESKDYRCFYFDGCRLKLSMAKDYESLGAVLETWNG